MANLTFTRGKAIFSGSGDWSSSSQKFRALLATKAYVPDRRHKHVTDVKSELSGEGYKRQDVDARMVKQNDEQERADCFAAPITFKGLRTTESYRWVVVFRAGANDSASDLVCAIDMGEISLRGMVEHSVRWDGQEKSGRVFSIA